MLLRPPPSAASTPAEIIAFETARGTNDWTGPQGAADGWLLLQYYQKHTLPTRLANQNILAIALGKLG